MKPLSKPLLFNDKPCCPKCNAFFTDPKIECFQDEKGDYFDCYSCNITWRLKEK